MYYFLLSTIVYQFFLTKITKEKFKLMVEILFIISLTFITFMVGLRYGVGYDYFNYEYNFNSSYYESNFEILYSVLVYVVKVLFDEFFYVTFIMAFISNVFFYLGIKKRNIKNEYLILSLFIFVTFVLSVHMNLMRQSVAVSIFFYCSTFIKERNFKKFLLFIILGAGFHYSILFLIPLYFIPNLRISKTFFLISVIISYTLVYFKIAPILLNSIFNILPMYNHYFNHYFLFNEDVNILSFGVLAKVLFSIILIFLYRSKKNLYSLEINYYFISIIFSILTISTFMFNRIGVFFDIFYVVAIPKIIEGIKNNKFRHLFFIFCVCFVLMFFILDYFVNAGTNSLEYKSIFSK